MRVSVITTSLLITTLLACEPHDEPVEDHTRARAPSQRTKPAIVAPGVKATIGSPWTPVLARLPDGYEQAQVRAELDGEPLELPSPVVRRRLDSKGGGLDCIAALDLEGREPGPIQLDLHFELPDGSVHTARRDLTYAPPPARVEAVVTDGRGPISARILVLDAEGKPVRSFPSAAQRADPGKRDIRFASHFAIDGRAAFHLEPGRYTLVAVRSLTDHIDAQEVTLEAGTTQLSFAVPTAVPTPGWIAADLHVHSVRSNDAYIPDLLRLRSIEAAGLDLVVISDHNRVSDLRPVAEAMPWSTVHLIPGVEARIGEGQAYGHLNAFPLTPDAVLPLHSGDVGAMIDAYRSLGPPMLLQLDHPRGIQFRVTAKTKPKAHALFSHKGYARKRAPGVGRNAWMTEAQPGTGTTPLDFDTLEIINRFSYDVWLRVRRDWFALMNHGRFLTGTGNSDSHALIVGQVGIPTNLVQVGEVLPEQVEAAFLRAVKDGRVVVTTGPVVTLRVEADGRDAGPGELITASDATAHVTVQAAPWVPVPELRLVQDGKVVHKVALDDAERGPDGSLHVQRSWTIGPGDADSWVLAEAGWPLGAKRRLAPEVPGLYSKIAHGAVPIGFTNPVRIDRDGNGRFDRAVKTSKPKARPASGGCGD